MPDRRISYFCSGDTLRSRSRSVGDAVLSGRLEVPMLPIRLSVDCEREISPSRLDLQPGAVECLSLARARTRWPDYRVCVQAVSDWTRSLGLGDGVLGASDTNLMACRGAHYHHDGAHYGGAAFCNLFVSEDKGLDLHFPATGQRFPLGRGTVVLFDTGQPHAVVQRGGGGFDVADFSPGRDCTQLFLTWELPIEDARLARLLGVTFDVDPSTASQIQQPQVWLNGAPASVCPDSGRWCAADAR
ncbi:MAG: hypothetical protein LH632_00455 [Rhodoferax sp.]|nr:hypothetical protein [Rhodoferax sp.]